MVLPDKLTKMKLYQPVTENYCVRLDTNESPISLDQDIRDEIAELISSLEFNRYPDPLASRVCALAAEFYGVSDKCITAGNGSDELISIIIDALVPENKPVFISEPDFSMYRFYGELKNFKILSCDRHDGTVDLHRLNDDSKNAGLIILSNPCNPTGRGAPRESIIKMISTAQCLVVIDEAYMDFWDQSIVDELENYPNLIILKTCSKAIGLAGIRLGFALANERLTGILRAVKSPYNVSTLTQAAAYVVFRKPDRIRINTRRILKLKSGLYEALLRWCDGVNDVKLINTETNFLLLELQKHRSLYEYLKTRSISVRLLDNVLRITVGEEAENNALIAACEEWKDEQNKQEKA